MSSPQVFGVDITQQGMTIAVNPNPVSLAVVHGPAGCILQVGAMGLSIQCALPAEARDHLIAMLQVGKGEGA